MSGSISENLIRSDDGALTTTLVGILAEREIPVTPVEATAFALGIHEDTGSLTYSTTTPRDVDALSWCLRHGARQESLASYLHTPLGDGDRALLEEMLKAVEQTRVGTVELLLVALSWPEYVDGVSNLVHRLVDLTDCPSHVCLVEMEGQVVCVARSTSAELRRGRRRARARRRRPRPGCLRDLARARSRRRAGPSTRLFRPRSGSRRPPSRSCRARLASSRRMTRSLTRWRCVSGTDRVGSRSEARPSSSGS